MAPLGPCRIPSPPLPSSQSPPRRPRDSGLAQLLPLCRPSPLPPRLSLPFQRQRLHRHHPDQRPFRPRRHHRRRPMDRQNPLSPCAPCRRVRLPPPSPSFAQPARPVAHPLGRWLWGLPRLSQQPPAPVLS